MDHVCVSYTLVVTYIRPVMCVVLLCAYDQVNYWGLYVVTYMPIKFPPLALVVLIIGLCYTIVLWGSIMLPTTPLFAYGLTTTHYYLRPAPTIPFCVCAHYIA